MPIYEYLCQDCSYKFEKKQSMKDDPVAACERCGKSVNRIISPPAIMFKGSGWYITDYSDKLKPPAGESSGAKPTSNKETAGNTAAPVASTQASATSATSNAGSGTSSPGSPTSSSGTTSSSTKAGQA